MRRQGNRARAGLALLVVALGMLATAGNAAAKLTGNYTRFAQCPFMNPEVRKCIYSIGEGGEFAMGGTATTSVNSTIIQAGFTAPNEDEYSMLVDASDGMTISRTPQPLPGGLLGLASSAKTPALFEAALKNFAKSRLNEVSTILEFARPTDQALISENNLAGETGPGLILPMKIHLVNPLLGRGCYIGSSASPIMLELMVGTTNPPPPNMPISGGLGTAQFLEDGRILELSSATLVDNSFSVPKASGCGLLLTPIINSRLGLPSPAGHNTMVMKSKLWQASAAAVRRNDEENP